MIPGEKAGRGKKKGKEAGDQEENVISDKVRATDSVLMD